MTFWYINCLYYQLWQGCWRHFLFIKIAPQSPDQLKWVSMVYCLFSIGKGMKNFSVNEHQTVISAVPFYRGILTKKTPNSREEQNCSWVQWDLGWLLQFLECKTWLKLHSNHDFQTFLHIKNYSFLCFLVWFGFFGGWFVIGCWLVGFFYFQSLTELQNSIFIFYLFELLW